MDLMMFSAGLLTVMVSMAGGIFCIYKFWPHYNLELDVSRAFDQADYHTVIQLTEGKTNKSLPIDVYLHAARARTRLLQHHEALEWFESLLRHLDIKNKIRVAVETEIADIYCALKDYTKAEMHYRTALSLAVEDPFANYKLASLLLSTDKPEQARQILRSLLKKNPLLAEARYLYAETLAVLGLYTKAIRHYGILNRAGEPILSFNYGRTLKALKIFERAAEVYRALLDCGNIEHKNQIIQEYAELCIILKNYDEGAHFIENALQHASDPQTILELRYMQASLFSERGDEFQALIEYQHLYHENPDFKDLSSINDKWGYILAHEYLKYYFTSQVDIFEKLIMRMLPPGTIILRRSRQYYFCLYESKAYLMYRHILPAQARFVSEIDLLILQKCPDINSLEFWSLTGISEPYSTTGAEYRFLLYSKEEFLTHVKQIVNEIE